MKQILILIMSIFIPLGMNAQLTSLVFNPNMGQCDMTFAVEADVTPCGYDGTATIVVIAMPGVIVVGANPIAITAGIGTFQLQVDPGVTGTFNIGFEVASITNQNGCGTWVGDSYVQSFTVTCPCDLTASAIVNHDETCDQECDGEAEVTGSGGTMPYSYLWSDPGAQTTAIAVDLCPGTYTVTITDDNDCEATAQVTISAGNIVVASVTKNQDETCPGDCDGSATASGGDTYLWSNGNTNATADDLCAGIHTVTVTDVDGCTDTETVEILGVDNTDPTAVCKNITVSLDGTGNVSITGADVDNGSMDDCGDVTLAVSPSTFTCANIGPNTVTLTVTDGSGNQATCTSIVTVEDNEAPVITTCPADITVDTDGGVCEATGVSLGTIVSTDNCGVATEVNNAPGTFPLGATTVIWTVTDDNGNTTTCEQIVTVEDNEAPVITTCPADITVDTDGGVCEATGVLLGDIVSTDNCGVATEVNDAPGTFLLGATTVVWTVTDDNGNTITCEQIVTVEDDEDPTMNCHATLTVELDGNGEGEITVADVDDGSMDNCSGLTFSLDITDFDCNDVGGTVNVILTGIDAAGNQSSCTTEVTVEDNEAPVITACPTGITVDTDGGVCEATGVSLGTIVSTDNCGVATEVNNAPGTFLLGATTVIWTVTDDNGNVTTCEQIVTVEDNEDPVIATCPADITVGTDVGVCEATGVSLGTIVSTDNCGVDTEENDAPSAFSIGATPVIWTVTDDNGNITTCEQIVTVEDNENPVMNCYSTLIVELDGDGEFELTVVDVNDGSTDNCGGLTFSLDITDLDCNDVGGTVDVELTGTDVAGNTATCITEVTVEDNENPTITCPLDVEVCEGTTVSLGTPTTADNCAVANVTNDAPGSYPVGATIVTWTVEDVNGNTNTCQQTVTIYANPVVMVDVIIHETCEGDEDGSITVSGGVSYLWSNGKTTATIENLAPDDYTVTITDIHDCTDETTITIDEGGVVLTWYQDADGDSFGDDAVSIDTCAEPSGYVLDSTDCDDTDATIYPGATELCDGLDNDCDGEIDNDVAITTFYLDFDLDGFGNDTVTIDSCAQPMGYVLIGGDCNDSDANINPNAVEVCDSIDNNCNGNIDEGVLLTYYADADVDSFGNPLDSLLACSVPMGYVENNQDCDDTDSLEFPGQVWFRDLDGDGHSSGDSLIQCERPANYFTAGELLATNGDCNDTEPLSFPGNPEVCDSIDNNCDGMIDEGVLLVFYRDQDEDDHGNALDSIFACSAPSGYVISNDDCNDDDDTIYPGAIELCDGKDNDCNGDIDDDVAITTFFFDADSDGFGNDTITIDTCAQPSGYVLLGGDCDDDDPLLNPETVWYLDGDGDSWSNGDTLIQCEDPGATYYLSTELTEIDGDCNDADNTVYPDAPELCDDLDNDCDGAIDEDSITSLVITEVDSFFVVEVVDGIAPFTYVWSTGSIDSFTLSQTGTTTVTVTDGNGCTYTDSIFVTATHNTRIEIAVKVYPNPTADMIYIDYIEGQYNDLRINIIDMRGRIVRTLFGKQEEISLGDLPTGLYHLHFISPKGVFTEKIIRMG